jgi:hypothetical protein
MNTHPGIGTQVGYKWRSVRFAEKGCLALRSLSGAVVNVRCQTYLSPESSACGVH